MSVNRILQKSNLTAHYCVLSHSTRKGYDVYEKWGK